MEKQTEEKFWKECIHQWYPNLHSQTYFLPPLYFNRVPYSRVKVAEQTVYVPQDLEILRQSNPSEKSAVKQKTILESDVRDDQAQGHVLQSLRSLASEGQEVMMVVSQLQFGKYLRRPSYQAAASKLPVPFNLPKEYHRGDFDVLIIHSKYGIITGEIKSVGATFRRQAMSESEENVAMLKKVKDGIKGLNKSEVVLSHLVSDLEGVNITKTLMVPNITSEQLTRALNTDLTIAKDLCQCLGVGDVRRAIGLCYCADYASLSVTTSTELKAWWQRNTTRKAHSMQKHIYETLIARFCGPATTVEVHCITSPRLELRTEGDAVSETGNRMAQFVLFPEQIEILTVSSPRAFLSGPPGTGKTVMLILKALTWLQEGHDVHVVSTWRKSRAAAFLVEHQLQKTLENWKSNDSKTLTSKINRHMYDLENVNEDYVKKAVADLSSAGYQNCIYVTADEAGPEDNSHPFKLFCDVLLDAVQTVYLWAASLYRHVKPKCLTEIILTMPLRSPPVVTKEIEKAADIRAGDVIGYKPHGSITSITAPDGLHVDQIRHAEGQADHSGDLPDDCEQCGKEVAKIVKDLRVSYRVNALESSSRISSLQYRDVLVLCKFPRDDIGLVRGIRQCGVPVRVTEYWADDDVIRDTALALHDVVTVTHWNCIRGLEKKVVFAMIDSFQSHRLQGVSRCSAKLVVCNQSWTSDETPDSSIMSYWIEYVRDWYPDLQYKTYFFPSRLSKRTLSSMKSQEGKSVVVPQIAEKQENRSVFNIGKTKSGAYFRFQFDQVFHCLHTIADHSQDAMMILSQLHFGQYTHQPSYTAAVIFFKDNNFRSQRHSDGDFDVLIIHSTYGLIIGEMKSLKDGFAGLPRVIQDAILIQKVKEAVQRLNKAEDVLRDLLADFQKVSIRKTLIMPNITSQRLISAVSKNHQLSQDVSQCLGVLEIQQAVELCLCADMIPTNFKEIGQPSTKLDKLLDWWKRIINRGSKKILKARTYERLVALLCGSAATIRLCMTPFILRGTNEEKNINETKEREVTAETKEREFTAETKEKEVTAETKVKEITAETKERGVTAETKEREVTAEAGEIISHFALNPDQINILNTFAPRVYLVGPPRTGKTVVLMVKALQWLQEGHDVHVVSTCKGSRGVSYLIWHQLQKTRELWFGERSSTKVPGVHLDQFDFTDYESIRTAINTLIGNKYRWQIHIISEESLSGYSERSSTCILQFCEMLNRAVPELFMWMSAVNKCMTPSCFQEVTLTRSLILPSTILSRMNTIVKTDNKAVDSCSSSPGKERHDSMVKIIEHFESGHTKVLPGDCEHCGQEVATILSGSPIGPIGPKEDSGATGLAYKLNYSDVLVLCDDPHDDRVDSRGNVISPANGFVKGLRERGIPVYVMERFDDTVISNMDHADFEKVIVTCELSALYLQWKVVVNMSVQRETHEAIKRGTFCNTLHLIKISDLTIGVTHNLQWYPEIHQRSYFVPPLHFNWVPYCRQLVSGQSVLVPRWEMVSELYKPHTRLTVKPMKSLRQMNTGILSKAQESFWEISKVIHRLKYFKSINSSYPKCEFISLKTSPKVMRTYVSMSQRALNNPTKHETTKNDETCSKSCSSILKIKRARMLACDNLVKQELSESRKYILYQVTQTTMKLHYLKQRTRIQTLNKATTRDMAEYQIAEQEKRHGVSYDSQTKSTINDRTRQSPTDYNVWECCRRKHRAHFVDLSKHNRKENVFPRTQHFRLLNFGKKVDDDKFHKQLQLSLSECKGAVKLFQAATSKLCVYVRNHCWYSLYYTSPLYELYNAIKVAAKNINESFPRKFRTDSSKTTISNIDLYNVMTSNDRLRYIRSPHQVYNIIIEEEARFKVLHSVRKTERTQPTRVLDYTLKAKTSARDNSREMRSRAPSPRVQPTRVFSHDRRVDSTRQDTLQISRSSEPYQPNQHTSSPLKQLPIVSDRDVREDKAQRRVLHGLRILTENLKEPIFVISQLSLDSLYESSFNTDIFWLPRPIDLDAQYRHNKSDLLIVHSKYGLMTCEIISEGDNFSRQMEKREENIIVARNIETAVKRLNKLSSKLSNILPDMQDLKSMKILMAPFLTSKQLLRAVNSHPQVGQSLQNCLGVESTTIAVQRCLCEDQLSSLDTCEELPHTMFEVLHKWWEQISFGNKKLPQISPQTYRLLVSRFCKGRNIDVSPRIEIKTQGEMVAETGIRMAQLRLYQYQVNIVNKSTPRMLLTGPPGTGKRTMLYLKGLQWLRAGHDVHIVSTSPRRRVVSFLLEYSLSITELQRSRSPKPAVHWIDFEEDERDFATTLLQLETSQNASLCIISDEVRFGDMFEMFCKQLLLRVPRVFMWAASIFTHSIPDWHTEEITVALRLPPVVLHQVQRSEVLGVGIAKYKMANVSAPTDGPVIKRLHHSNAPGHSQGGFEDCEWCGHGISHVLRDLHVNITDRGSNIKSRRLNYNDVVVLCRNPRDDSQGHETSQKSGLVKGLRDCHVPVHVIDKHAREYDLRDVALAVRNVVTVAHWEKVVGLERKVVVMRECGGYKNLLCASCCTSQLVIID